MIHFLNNSSEKPFSVFRKKYANALSARQDIIEAIAISSYSNEKNEVDSRFVNLKVVDGKDFIFFSNYLSPKAMQFQDHKQISALIHWSSTNTQIRMKANIKKTSISYNNNYFASRSEKKNALAISSSQSNFIKSYSEVEKNYIAALNSDNLKECPGYWGGYSFSPYYFEFWQGHSSRLNKREVFNKNNENWDYYLLQP